MTQLKPAVCQVDLGRPDFIEIKGVTYCGDGGTTSSLTMGNVPYHADVVATGQAICQARQGEHYGRCSPLALGATTSTLFRCFLLVFVMQESMLWLASMRTHAASCWHAPTSSCAR